MPFENKTADETYIRVHHADGFSCNYAFFHHHIAHLSFVGVINSEEKLLCFGCQFITTTV